MLLAPFQSRTRAYPSSDFRLSDYRGNDRVFQSRTRAYPSSDVLVVYRPVRSHEPFNPALGLIHLLTPAVASGRGGALLPFNPALGLIHLLT